MAEVVITHVSTPRRIEEFNKIVTQLEIPYEGKMRKGATPIFPYKKEDWIYKMKDEAVPVFLEFVKANTDEISGMQRPAQGLANSLTWLIKLVVTLRDTKRKIKCFLTRYPYGNTPHGIELIDMLKVKKGPKLVRGWGYAKVWFRFKDHYNNRLEEEL